MLSKKPCIQKFKRITSQTMVHKKVQLTRNMLIILLWEGIAVLMRLINQYFVSDHIIKLMGDYWCSDENNMNINIFIFPFLVWLFLIWRNVYRLKLSSSWISLAPASCSLWLWIFYWMSPCFILLHYFFDFEIKNV